MRWTSLLPLLTSRYKTGVWNMHCMGCNKKLDADNTNHDLWFIRGPMVLQENWFRLRLICETLQRQQQHCTHTSNAFVSHSNSLQQ